MIGRSGEVGKDHPITRSPDHPILRISLVDFLNARPLVWGLLHEPPEGVSISRDLPSVCSDKLAEGSADVGLIPSVDYQRIPGLRVVPGLGIAASSEVRSVLLVSRVSREKIGSVALDPASRTSAVLTRILLKRVYGLEPEYRETENGKRKTTTKADSISVSPFPFSGRADLSAEASAEADARLIIGDPALKTRLNGHVVLDLAAEWRAFSGHPFVFAFWAARAEVATSKLSALLRRSYEAGCRHFDLLVREEAARTGLSEAVIDDYLRHSLHHELTDSDHAGLDLFYQMAAEEGLIEEAKPLQFL